MNKRGRVVAPNGITLLEVLIAIGILAIGLSSVVAIIPAARSQAARAVILDRAAALAANTLADAATFGLLRSGTDTLFVSGPASVIVIDPEGTTLSGTGTVYANVQPRATGLFGGGNAAPAAAQRAFLQSRDDVTTSDPATEDDPPNNQMIDGVRGFKGTMSSLLCLSGTGTQPNRASVVVFHRRDTTVLTVAGTMSHSLLSFTPPAGRTAGDIIRPGVVIWDRQGRRFHQIVTASPNFSGSAFFLTLHSGNNSLTTDVEILPDSVGLAERMFSPESAGSLAP
jgi:type II secretory pathway pseudopilin PulG